MTAKGIMKAGAAALMSPLVILALVVFVVVYALAGCFVLDVIGLSDKWSCAMIVHGWFFN